MIKVDPGSWIFKWASNKREAELRIADYLDEISTEATNLAMIWQKIVENIIQYGSATASNSKNWTGLVEIPKEHRFRNAQPYSRLEEFYRNTSTVLGANHKDNIEPIIFHIGSIIEKRNLTKIDVERKLKSIRSAAFFDDDNCVLNMQSLEDSVMAIHKEAAALHTYAKSFRAKIN